MQTITSNQSCTGTSVKISNPEQFEKVSNLYAAFPYDGIIILKMF